MKYQRIVRVMVGELAEEIVKVLLRNKQPDLYYNLERKIIEAMENAYKEGLAEGKKEITDALEKFDTEKDKLES